MTTAIETAGALGAAIQHAVSRDKKGCEVAVEDLEAAGLAVDSLAYADWLTNFNLRTLGVRKGAVQFVSPYL